MGVSLRVTDKTTSNDDAGKDITCLYANIQSVFNKKKEIELYIRENPKDLMCFTECFITEDHCKSEFMFNGYQCFVAMKNRGGACVYVSEKLNCCEVRPPNRSEDSCWVVMKTKNMINRIYGMTENYWIIFRGLKKTTRK